jgi:hypothetical protein
MSAGARHAPTPRMRHAMKMSTALIRQVGSGVLVAVLCAPPNSADAQERRDATAERVAADYRFEPPGLIGEPAIIERVVIFGDRHFGNGEITNGFYGDFFNMIPGAGWISGGPGYRQWYSKDRVFLDASTAISWRGYKTAQGRVELPRLAGGRLLLGSQMRLQDFMQVSYFGEGSDALESNISEYRLRSKNLVGYATLRPVEWIDIDTHIGWLEPSVLARGGAFKRDRPDTQEVFPDDPVYALSEQPTFIHSEATITADTRDFAGHPTRGGVVRAAAAHYSDRDSHLFSFRRFEAEAARFLPLADARVILALHGWVVGSDTGNGQTVPFYLQPSLGGHNSLRGYADYRFHDRNLLLVNAEARIAIMTHVDAAVFVDAGNVASRLGDLNLDKRSYGAGLRLHSRRKTYARLDVARSDEGWRFLLRLTEPLDLSRISRRRAAVPFVP